MAWNEPGKGQDPWKSGNGEQGPPDLDEVVRNLQRRLSGMFGGGKGSGTSGSFAGLGLILMAIFVAWLGTGIYKIDEAERGVIMQFGKYSEITMPGLRWHLPWPIEKVEKVNVSKIRSFPNKTVMLTADENIVDIDLTVQYRAADANAYLFNVRDPDQTLNDVSESAIREVVGKSGMDFVLGEGRTEIAQRTRTLIQETLDQYGTGIEVTSVNVRDAQPPEQVQAAVEDAIKAREDKERFRLEAQAYANDILPRARGQAVRRIEEAEAYKQQVVADAQGEADRFLKLLAEYQKAPQVTRQRLYLQTVEAVLKDANKVIVDVPDGNSLMYLPLDKLIEQGKLMPSIREYRPGGEITSSPSRTEVGSTTRDRRDLRSREDRG